MRKYKKLKEKKTKPLNVHCQYFLMYYIYSVEMKTVYYLCLKCKAEVIFMIVAQKDTALCEHTAHLRVHLCFHCLGQLLSSSSLRNVLMKPYEVYGHLTCSIVNAQRRQTLRLSRKEEKSKQHFLSYNLFLQRQDHSSSLFMFHLLTDSTDCDRFILSRSMIFMNDGRVLFYYVTSNDKGFVIRNKQIRL